MTRKEIIAKFRQENSEITSRVLTDDVLSSWLLTGNLDYATRLRCLVDQDGQTLTTTENQKYIDLTTEIVNFYDIDERPSGGGVVYNNKRLTFATIAELDRENIVWRSRNAGTPKKYYRRGQFIYFDRPIDSNAEDIKIYCILLPDDFDADNKEPLNEIIYYRPFHNGFVKYLEWQAMGKIGKPQDEAKALGMYNRYVDWAKKEIGMGKYSSIQFINPERGNYGTRPA